ncbi:MAG: hypothetical protein ABL964_02830 [Steroidobacteraceae bacterium]
MRLSFCIAATVVVLVAPATASAIEDYRCTIERVIAASGTGGPVQDLMDRTYVGKEFTVERETGLMAGALKNSFFTSPHVVDRGSTENSFKVVTTMTREQGTGAGSNVYVLVVNEFAKGERKPFIYLNNDLAYIGDCIHF